MRVDLTEINRLRAELETHPLLATTVMQTQQDLQIFMQHHVYAVWDFMSLAKGLQAFYTPQQTVWRPTSANRSSHARMINEILLSEELDTTPDGKGTISHFDLYLMAMQEVGASTSAIYKWIDSLDSMSFDKDYVPAPANRFMSSTFDAIAQGPHAVAASFCFGRETVIPAMFIRILAQLDLGEFDAPKFHYYLERHVHLDGEDHGPKAADIVNDVCERMGGSPTIYYQAEQAAVRAIRARIEFFDGIRRAIILSN
jgi:hypothetical protein